MAFDYASLIQQYGYVATFAGTRIERELFGGALVVVVVGVVVAKVWRARRGEP